MKKLRIGVIGAGGIAAKLHFPELLALPDQAEITLIAGRKEPRLKLLCERFGIPRYTQRAEDVIADDKLDGVIVATPHPQHVEWGIKALEAGKHLYMQKPLCGEMAEADAFVAACEKHRDRVVLCLPHFPDAVHTVRHLVRQGAIGKVTGGRSRTSHGGPEVYYREIAQIFGESEADDLWFFDAKRAGVGALFDMGVYSVARMAALLGTIRRVTAVTATIDKPTQLEDTATLILQSDSGAVATAETSWCDPGRTWEFSVHGTAGKFTMPQDNEALLHMPEALDRDNAPIRVTSVEPTVRVGNSHEHWLDCIARGEQPPVSNCFFARHVTEILLAGLEAGDKGAAVEVRTKIDR